MYIGNTPYLYIAIKIAAVYPCVYREHVVVVVLSIYGLSLCIQETRGAAAQPWVFLRFIPVYTGNTTGEINSNLVPPVYPCVYREHGFIVFFCLVIIGLSLCVQGTHINNYRQLLSDRFIPVCTGNTVPAAINCCPFAVYPCVYREHPTLA